MKILTVCQGGNVSCVGLGYLLKYALGHDAIACSIEKNAKSTLNMLAKWADKIILLDKTHLNQFIKLTGEKYNKKIMLMDVGPDKWSNSLHPELIAILSVHIGYHPELAKKESLNK